MNTFQGNRASPTCMWIHIASIYLCTSVCVIWVREIRTWSHFMLLGLRNSPIMALNPSCIVFIQTTVANKWPLFELYYLRPDIFVLVTCTQWPEPWTNTIISQLSVDQLHNGEEKGLRNILCNTWTRKLWPCRLCCVGSFMPLIDDMQLSIRQETWGDKKGGRYT